MQVDDRGASPYGLSGLQYPRNHQADCGNRLSDWQKRITFPHPGSGMKLWNEI